MTEIEMKSTSKRSECRMIAEVVGGGYYQPNYERFNRIYSADGISPTIATRCDRFSSFWIMEGKDENKSDRNVGHKRHRDNAEST